MKEKKLERVAAVAGLDERKEAGVLAQCQAQCRDAQEQLEQLRQYRVEYEENLTSNGRRGLDSRLLQDYRAFLSRLNEGIAQQELQVQEALKRLEEARNQWLAKSRRKSALDQLVETRQKQHTRKREKAEQQRLDELSLNRLQSGED